MSNKKLKILEMIEQKKITAEEGMELLRILEEKKRKKREKEEKAGLKSSGNYQAAEIVKLSANEYEILPAKDKTGTKLKKQGLFSKGLFGGGRKLVIRVEEKGKAVVNLRFPLGLMAPFIKGGLKIGGMKSSEFQEYINHINPEELDRYINNGYVGPIIDIHDAEDDEHVYIGIE